jgi:hypothetical protein
MPSFKEDAPGCAVQQHTQCPLPDVADTRERIRKGKEDKSWREEGRIETRNKGGTRREEGEKKKKRSGLVPPC